MHQGDLADRGIPEGLRLRALPGRRPNEPLAGTLAPLGHCVDAGGHIVNVHDVVAARGFLTVRAALRGELDLDGLRTPSLHAATISTGLVVSMFAPYATRQCQGRWRSTTGRSSSRRSIGRYVSAAGRPPSLTIGAGLPSGEVL
jgi:hypothetical protein